MANKTLFQSLVGKLLPAADAVNEAGGAGLRAVAQARAGAVRRDGLPERDVLRRRPKSSWRRVLDLAHRRSSRSSSPARRSTPASRAT